MSVSGIGYGNYNYTNYANYTMNGARAQRAKDAQGVKSPYEIECQTCKNRTYQDVSNDPGVSFKAPGRISPSASAAVVRSHEQEHVSNERAKAQREGKQVVSQTVTIYTAVCPECGRSYVSGGVTRTTVAGKRNIGLSGRSKAGLSGQKFDMSV